MREINFIEVNLRKAAAQAEVDRRCLVGAMVLLGVVVVVWLGLLGYNVVLKAQTQVLQAEAAALEKEILAFSAGKIDYVTFMTKAKGISDIIALRCEALPLMAATADYLTTSEVLLSSIDYSMSDRLLRMKYSMTDVFQAEVFYKKLSDPDFRNWFEAIDYGSLSRVVKGSYSTNLTFHLKI